MKSFLLLFSFGIFAVQAQAQQAAMFGIGITAPYAPPVFKPFTSSSASVPTISAPTTTSSARNSNPSAQQFSTDIVVKPDTTNQRHVKIATAFNGWIFAAYTINYSGAAGVQIKKSTDGGLTWNDFAASVASGVDYPAIDLVVAGNDTANLNVFLAGVINNIPLASYGVWLDKYHATTGAFLGENFGEGNTYPIYDVAIATDYRHPSIASAPYSIGLIYSKRASYDSVIYVTSLDAGVTYGNRQAVFSTARYAHKVAISFLIGSTYSNGRYAMAFEEFQNSGDIVGHIIYTHNSSDPTSGFEAPVYIDSANSYATNLSRDPKIACMNDGFDNSYGNSSVVVTVNADFGAGDWEVIGLVSVMGVYSALNNWTISLIETPGNNESQGDLVYNEANQGFYSTRYDSLHQKLKSDTVGISVLSASWSPLSAGYNDLSTNLQNPWPSISINPVTGTSNYAWNSEGPGGKGIALFDSENNTTGISAITNAAAMLAYPNPSGGTVNFNFTLKENENVELAVFNLLGEEVLPANALGILPAGEHAVPADFSSLPNGIYIYQVKMGNKIVTGRIIIAH